MTFLVVSLMQIMARFNRVANSTYIITPYNVDIMGDLLDELENSGVFF